VLSAVTAFPWRDSHGLHISIYFSDDFVGNHSFGVLVLTTLRWKWILMTPSISGGVE
jgi:hypothetical protein